MHRLYAAEPSVAAGAINDLITPPASGRFYVLPYNWREGEHGRTWWLSPANEVPSYSRGKIIVSNADRHGPRTEFHCGLHVEKGYEESPANPKQKMRKDWAWHGFVRDIASGELSAAARDAIDAYGDTLTLRIIAYLETSAADSDEFAATVDRSGSLADSKRVAGRGSTVLKPLESCASLQDIGDVLISTIQPSARWHWIDFYVTARFESVASRPDELPACVRMLECFKPWIK